MSEEAPYIKQLKRKIAERIARHKAQEAAEAAVDWLTYPQAVHRVLPILFGSSWVGLASEQERVVLKLGPSHADWSRYSLLHAEREEQIARAERWLLVSGMVEDLRGSRRVRAERLEAAIAEEAEILPPPAAVAPRSAPEPIIRRALRAVYNEEQDPPNKVKVVPLVLRKLIATGLKASGRQIQEIASEPEFTALRGDTGVRIAYRKSRAGRPK